MLFMDLILNLLIGASTAEARGKGVVVDVIDGF